MRRKPVCEHCGMDHPTERCNRPEGIAARGYALTFANGGARRSWRGALPHKTRRGGRLGAKVNRRKALQSGVGRA